MKINLISPSAYDTSWIARIKINDKPAFPKALEWLREKQQTNGSWGGQIENYHDRIINTFGAIETLEYMGNTKDKIRIQKGYSYISTNLINLEKDSHKTFGFELIVPRIAKSFDKKNIMFPEEILKRYKGIIQQKKSRIPQHFYKYPTTLLNYIELLEDLLPKSKIKELPFTRRGGLAASPAATAWYYNKTQDLDALNYLKDIYSNLEYWPTLYPIEISEIGWVMYNRLMINEINQGELEFLKKKWDSKGVGFSEYFPVIDLDSTAMVFKALNTATGFNDVSVLKQFESGDHFICYIFERQPSIGANIHLLDAIKGINNADTRRMKKKLIRFLHESILDDNYWIDKWHLSPYYITSHAITALDGLEEGLKDKAVSWILDTQKDDGSWGVFNNGTCEETAYCVLSLNHLKNKKLEVKRATQKGIEYLKKNHESYAYPELWVAKVLYSHKNIPHSAIDCALKIK